jgi:hypothetical protein
MPAHQRTCSAIAHHLLEHIRYSSDLLVYASTLRDVVGVLDGIWTEQALPIFIERIRPHRLGGK